MYDESKKPYSANWIIKHKEKSYVPGINQEPLYLTDKEAAHLLELGAITELKEN